MNEFFVLFCYHFFLSINIEGLVDRNDVFYVYRGRPSRGSSSFRSWRLASTFGVTLVPAAHWARIW